MIHHTANFHPTHLPFDTLLIAVNVFAVVLCFLVVAICCSSQRICSPDRSLWPRPESWWRARTGRGDGRANAHFMEERKS